jgi:FAD/FMN-containing dehydrogenase
MSEAMGAESDKELVEELRKLIKGDVCSQFDPDYHREVRGIWNARLYEKKPLLYAYVQRREDISGTLKFCKKHKVSNFYLTIRGGYWNKL